MTTEANGPVCFHGGRIAAIDADGKHLAPELLEFALRMIGPKRLCLVSDSSRALDMPAGRYIIGPQTAGKPIRSDGAGGYTIDHDTGSLEVGKRADLIVLDQDLAVRQCFIGGREFTPP